MADTPRLKVKYQTEIVPALVEQLGIKNINCVPKLEKIVVNMGVGAAAGDSKLLDAAMNDMRIITGQQPCVTRAKKSIAGFHVREGQAIGCKVTLRGDRMWEFLDRLLATAEELRRPRQLHPGHHRAAHLPRDRVRQDRPHPRHGHHLRDQCRRQRFRVRSSVRPRLPVQEQVNRPGRIGPRVAQPRSQVRDKAAGLRT